MIVFVVPGKAATAGSKRVFGGRVVEDNKRCRPWQALVVDAAQQAYDGPLLDGPLILWVIEQRRRPKGHTGVRGLTKAGRAQPCPTSKPDVLKVARAVEDALTGVLWHDDSQVVHEVLAKEWADDGRERTIVRVWRYEPVTGGES